MPTKPTKKPARRPVKARRAAPKAAKGRVRKAVKPMAEPPRTTTGKWFTAPKFGSAGSGGAEFEPGPERA
ncbi:MAG: hypothetical protein KGL38_03280 [Gemmatimonadota bacterium]|nr:hypothetical protein [Gemmatimonadota bacterium]MDE3126999.1 hypothetical protein [Gemmatimonadota bacterium]MDE3174265.1 hypothetical protein [Gemmatimonadota bacterium]MDE3215757.1 hypothetical protein [Gemmatimonadota bacterium]